MAPTPTSFARTWVATNSSVVSSRLARAWPASSRISTSSRHSFAVAVSARRAGCGEHQACAIAQQPGFTRWGAFAQYCTIPYAATNAVVVPETLTNEVAALVGCRVSTAYRGVVERGRVAAGEVLCVYGCGGVGLAAVGFGRALGAKVIAIDRSAAALALATTMGADAVLDAAASTTHPRLSMNCSVAPMCRSTVSATLPSPATRSAACAHTAATYRSGCFPLLPTSYRSHM